MNDVICLCTVYDSQEADLIKSKLEDSDIDCFLKSDNAGGALPYLTMTTGIGIMIRKEDKDISKELLEDNC